MLLNTYKDIFNQYFSEPQTLADFESALQILTRKPRIFFIGNGGSNSISSHMYEDYGKMARIETFAFSDPALITCYANDYGYENAFAEWLKLYFKSGDLLIAISSSGSSKNILNAVDMASNLGGDIITLSGFKADNPLRTKGRVNFYIPSTSYGIVECYHQVVLHVILDELLLRIKA
jgi:D-sedoheptulose 7-phosphate isomerase